MENTTYFASSAYLNQGWSDNVLISVDQAGWITSVETNQNPPSDAIRFDGPLLPGMINLHSHAFQRGMAGLAECATGEHDSFWTWRDIMYRFLEKLTPEDQEAIAAQLYVEMLKAGFTTVGEFHYVHHQPDGTPYEDRVLTSRHILNAAKHTGISITHLPVLYACSGFGGQKPTEGQKRFINETSQFVEMLNSLSSDYQNDPQITLGMAFHSLRAVTPEMIRDICHYLQKLKNKMPIHIHIAEQLKEVEACLAWSNKRPVEWLLENFDVNHSWCLVHATHMTEMETISLAKSGAIVGICPTTEANLGDGIFNLSDFLNHQGKIGIGSDSHISVSMIEELRMLEYAQRLTRRERAIVKEKNLASTGASLYRRTLQGGAAALHRSTGVIEKGHRADFIILDSESPSLLFKRDNFILDSMIFASNTNPIRHVISGGKWVVRDFHHLNEGEIFENYKMTLAKFLGTGQSSHLSQVKPAAISTTY